MDVHIFFKNRIDFLRQLYHTTSAPYIERKRLIDSGESPYDLSSCHEDSEPPFLDEWLEADQSLRVLGQMLISALAASLQLYLKESLVNIPRLVGYQKIKDLRPLEDYRKKFKSEGWLTGYQAYFNKQFGIDFHKSECNLNILEGLVLARNRSQHPDTITSLDVHHAANDLKKAPNPFFVDRQEIELLGDEPFPSFFYAPTITAKEVHIETAFSEVEKFCTWLEGNIGEWCAT
jgi:hypothetical protein